MTTSTSTQAALVTGGASGIGRAYVRRLVERGYRVAVLDLPGDNLDSVGAEHGGVVSPIPLDVTDHLAVGRTVGEAEGLIGPIDHAFACAGLARVGPTLGIAHTDVDLMMRVNYGGVVSLAAAVIPRMIERDTGAFVAMASATGLIPPRKMAAYGASKAAVVSHMQSLRYDLAGTGVALACVCPTAVKTPMAEDFFADPAKRARSMATTPERVVSAIERGLERGRFLILPGATAKGMAALNHAAPGLVRRLQRSSRFDLVD